MEDQSSLNISQEPTTEPAQIPPADDASRMEAVRELLFGRQLVEMNQSLGSVEERLTDGLVKGKRVLEQQLESLETFARDEFGSVRDAIGREESARNRSESEARTRMESIEIEISAKARRITDEIARLEKTMHERFLEQTKLFGKKLEEAIDLMREDHNREIRALQESKTDRSTLGDLMIDLGMRLQGGEVELTKENNQSGRTVAQALGDTLSN